MQKGGYKYNLNWTNLSALTFLIWPRFFTIKRQRSLEDFNTLKEPHTDWPISITFDSTAWLVKISLKFFWIILWQEPSSIKLDQTSITFSSFKSNLLVAAFILSKDIQKFLAHQKAIFIIGSVFDQQCISKDQEAREQGG